MAEVRKRVGTEGKKGFFSCRLLSARFSAGRAQPPVACDSHFNSEPPGGSLIFIPHDGTSAILLLSPSARSIFLHLSPIVSFVSLPSSLSCIPVFQPRSLSLLPASPPPPPPLCLSPGLLSVEKLSEASQGMRETG